MNNKQNKQTMILGAPRVKAIRALGTKLFDLPDNILDDWTKKLIQDSTRDEIDYAKMCMGLNDNLDLDDPELDYSNVDLDLDLYNLDLARKMSLIMMLIELHGACKTLTLLAKDLTPEMRKEFNLPKLLRLLQAPKAKMPEGKELAKRVRLMHYNRALTDYCEAGAAIDEKFDKMYPNAADHPADFTEEEYDAFTEIFKTDANYKRCVLELVKRGDILIASSGAKELKEYFDASPSPFDEYFDMKEFVEEEGW